MGKLIDPPLGMPPLAPETVKALHEVTLWPGWTWWRDGEWLCARSGDRQVRAHNHGVLLKRIRKAEGRPRGGGGREA